MKITLLQVGRTEGEYLITGISEYESRLKHYISYQTITIPALKNQSSLSTDMQKVREGEEILGRLKESDVVILLDEHGKQYTSEEYAGYIQKHMSSGAKSVVFVIGGPFGLSDQVMKRANGMIAFSKMTFSHQMIRLIFTEQLYRAFTILRGEKYHHK